VPVRVDPRYRLRNGCALYVFGALFDKVEDLIKLCRKEIEGSEDGTVGPQIVPWRDELSEEGRVELQLRTAS